MRPTAQLSCALLVLVLPSALAAQDTAHAPALREGAHVRIWTSNGPTPMRSASVVAVRRDTIFLEAPDPGEQIAVAFADVRRLEVRATVATGSQVATGAVLGLVAGATAGALLGQFAYTGPRRDGYGPLPGVGAVAGGVLGLLVGGVIGLSMSNERWMGVPLPLRTAIAPRLGGDRGLALSFSAQF